jgi:di/tricarboxylate transporter
VILAVSRNRERVKKRIGDIVLKTGDTLLIEAPTNFLEQFKNSSDFYLISSIGDAQPPNYEKSGMAWSILLLMVLTAAFGILSMFQASFLAAGLMVASGCLHFSSAKKSIDWTVLLVIGATLGIGNGMEVTGVATALSSVLMGFIENNPYWALVGVYISTWVLTEMITNNAAAVLIFPVAISVAATLGVNNMPFVMTIIMAASASFSTPIGYQTNLMVYGPGGYRFTDFTKIGLPLNLLIAAITILLVPYIWPF